ncbi:MAG: NAD-dependent protein deacetylase [Mycobacteriales bacterium]
MTALEQLADLVGDGDVVVLSGAGLSTESGIPDYRGPSGLARRATPMTLQTFRSGPAARQRYWARSHVGWQAIARAAPNDGHRAVETLQRAGVVDGIVTQNVDGLHQAAGAVDVLELHGSLDRVVCLECGNRSARVELDRRLLAANRGWRATAMQVNPDGDVELSQEAVGGFRVVDCGRCGGVLKPDVVFFGENVPRERVDRAFALVEGASCLLVLGSSLTVMSGYRFVLRAAKIGVPVAIVNEGVTRGDAQATLKVDARLGELLPELANTLGRAA